MPHTTYRALPIEALYELLEISVRDMLDVYESKADNMIPFNALKKQVLALLDAIELKKKERKN